MVFYLFMFFMIFHNFFMLLDMHLPDICAKSDKYLAAILARFIA